MLSSIVLASEVYRYNKNPWTLKFPVLITLVGRVHQSSARVQHSSVMVQHSSVRVHHSSVRVQYSSVKVQHSSVGSALACCTACPSSGLGTPGWFLPLTDSNEENGERMVNGDG